MSARIGQLPDAQKHVLEVLTFGEPLGVALLAGLTDPVAVEQIEARGLVEVYSDGRRLQARLAHPLYGEVQRARVGRLHARPLRGRIAGALAATGARRADDTLRRAVLALDSDLQPDPVLFTDAARRATELGNPALAAWVARAAVDAGGGFESRLLLGEALGWCGRGAEAESFKIGLHQAAVVVLWWLRALLLAGLLDHAEHTSRRYGERCQDTPGLGHVIASLMYARVAMFRGQASTAARWYRQAIAAIHGGDPGGVSFYLFLGLTWALGMAGEASAACQAFAELTAARHPGFTLAMPDVLLAHAWVAAAEGTISQAVTLARQAAEVATAQGQPALEVLALHTAVCFGDRTVADRIAQLATQVDGPAHRLPPHTLPPWPPATPPHCTPPRSSWSRWAPCCWPLMSPLRPLPRTPVRVRRDSAQAAATRAYRLAQACEGARTPALATLATPCH